MQTTAQRFNVPAGFSGWWCARCEAACPTIPDDVDAAQTKCPKCHRWTAWWIPPSQTAEGGGQKAARQPAGRALESEMAGPTWERKRPRDEDAKRLFEHMHAVIENPGLNPSLRELDEEQAKA